MKTHALALVLGSAALASAVAADLPFVTRIFRAPRHVRGNTNILKVQPIDRASWIWSPDDSGVSSFATDFAAMTRGVSNRDFAFLKFRRRFATKPGDGRLLIDVSADERFYLTVDGAFVARGPNRSTVENWQYQTYEIALPPGEHVFEATVWRTGDHGPLAQLSYRGGFVLKADGAYDAVLTTGKAAWEVGSVSGVLASIGKDNGVWGTGDQWQMTGTGFCDAQPAKWTKAVVVRGPAGADGPQIWGGRTGGWMLFPTQLPDQTESRVRVGRVKAATRAAAFRAGHVYTEAETRAPELAALNDLVAKGKPWTVPPRTRLQAAWDLGVYHCAYPELVLSGGKGARVAWCWAESAQDPETKRKGAGDGSRDLIVGRVLNGYGDTFASDGRARGVFSTPWFRCGKWCRLDIETGDEPLTVADLALVESRYPLEMEGAFAAKDDPSIAGIRRLSLRTMQMCSHEMLFDCPYYEQQMYPGDTRVQLNILSAITRDDRLIRRAIELFDLATRDDGQCPFNWPTRGTQEGATYTLCYLLMHGDYAMNHADRDWLRARLPGMRKSMAGMEYYENAEGLLENLPGWQFMDWVVGWRYCGEAPGGRIGEGVNAEANLFWALAMKSAATVERALGHELQARYWDEKRARLSEAIVRRFWSADRALLADTPALKDFSEHAQCLALVGDVLPADKAQQCFGHLVSDPDLKRTTVYFNFYLFECYFKFGRGDLFLKRLDLWRTYVKKGLTTSQESPDVFDAKGAMTGEARSDCHAWGAHPIWFTQTGLAGIRSDAPFFGRVRVAPCPGPLTQISAKHPHPQGFVEVELAFDGGRASGVVRTPVAGTFVYGGQTLPLKPGANRID